MKKLYTFLVVVATGITILRAQPKLEWNNILPGKTKISSSTCSGIAVDKAGNVYAAGDISDTVDVDPGLGVQFMITPRNQNKNGNVCYITKYNALGQLFWVKSLIIRSVGRINVAVDEADNLYVSGTFSDTVDFDPGSNDYLLNTGGWSTKSFLLHLSKNGDFIGARDYPSSLELQIKTDAANNVYIAGNLSGTFDIDPGSGSYLLTGPGSFVQKLRSDGHLIFAKTVSGSISQLDVSHDGLIYLGGIYANPSNSFVQKLDANGNSLWIKVSSDLNREVMSVAVDEAGNAYTISTFRNNFMFQEIIKHEPDGDTLWVKTVTDTSFVPGSIIGYLDVDSEGNIYVSGSMWGTVDFNTGIGVDTLSAAWVYNPVGKAFSDIFISQLDRDGNFKTAQRFGGWGEDQIYTVVVGQNGNVYTGGRSFDTTITNFPAYAPGSGIDNGASTLIKWNLKMVVTDFKNMPPKPAKINISLFPNPTTGALTIASDYLENASEVKITDVYGKVISTILPENSNSIKVYLEGPAGIYTVTVKSLNESAAFRVIKQ